MTKKSKRFFSLCLLAILCLSTTSIVASAAENKAVPKYTVVEEFIGKSGIIDAMYVPQKDDTIDKEAYGRAMDKLLNRNTTVGAKVGGTYNISDKDSLTHNGYELYSKFSSTIEWDLIQSSKVSGSSRASWTGINPFNADKITLTDKITFAGIVVSVSASGPNWSTTMQSATWTASQDNQWQIDHIYSDITCVGYDIYIKQVTTGDFKFGTTYYTTSAIDSQWL